MLKTLEVAKEKMLKQGNVKNVKPPGVGQFPPGN